MVGKRHLLALVLGTSPSSGGGNDYERELARLLWRFASKSSGWNVKIFHLSSEGHASELINIRTLEWVNLFPNKSWSEKLSSLRKSREQKLAQFEQHLIQLGCSLIYFASPNRVQTEIRSLPFISTVWDVGHRDLPEFPEFRGRTWLERERLFTQALPSSYHVFTDSSQTAQKVSMLYGVDLDRISSLGLLFVRPEANTSISLPKGLEGVEYFVYPAKMWSHKNHITVVRAFSQLVPEFPNARLVFTGCSPPEDTSRVMSAVHSLGLTSHILNLGYLGTAELDSLIARAVALLMPTYLGPTNIPPLQALSLGTPAICSDVHTFEQDVQNHLVLVCPENINDWARAMKTELLARRRIPAMSWAGDKDAEREINRVLVSFARRSAAWEW